MSIVVILMYIVPIAVVCIWYSLLLVGGFVKMSVALYNVNILFWYFYSDHPELIVKHYSILYGLLASFNLDGFKQFGFFVGKGALCLFCVCM
mgnify:CR=1 FL=1